MESAVNNTASRTTAKVLIISDEPDTARIWGFSLMQVGLEVSVIGISDSTLQTWAEALPDLIIIEDFNTQIEELELCQQLRAETVVPILYMTTKVDEGFLLEAYRVGADECVPFPVSPRLFQAKVKAWLRRVQAMPMTALDEVQAGAFRLNPANKRLVNAASEVIKLTVLEARLLYQLMSHPGWIFEPDRLVERVWGYYGDGDSALLKNLVYRLRRKIEPDPGRPRYLLTEASAGYKFVAGVASENIWS